MDPIGANAVRPFDDKFGLHNRNENHIYNIKRKTDLKMKKRGSEVPKVITINRNNGAFGGDR